MQASADAACHATAPRPARGYMKWTSTAAGVSGDSSKEDGNVMLPLSGNEIFGATQALRSPRWAR